MSYKEKWSDYRSKTKVNRAVGLKKLLKKVEDIAMQKVEELL